MTTLIGVYGNDSDLELAINRLNERNISDIRVIDRDYEAPQPVDSTTVVAGLGAANQASTMSGAYAAPFFLPGFFGLADTALTGEYLLSRADLDDLTDEEADFYAEAVRNKGKLLIVHADDNQADAVRHIFLNTNAGQYTQA